VDVRVGVRVCACFDCDGCARRLEDEKPIVG
jgi:hypothetical protein